MNAFRFLMDLVNVSVVSGQSLLDWLSSILNIAEELLMKADENTDDSDLRELNPGAAATILTNLVLVTLTEVTPGVISKFYEPLAAIQLRLTQIIEKVGYVRSLSMRSKHVILFNDDVKLESYSELILNWRIFLEQQRKGESNRYRLAFYDYPILRDHSAISKFLTPAPGFEPLVLMPLRTEGLGKKFYQIAKIEDNQSYNRLPVMCRYNVPLLGPQQLREIQPRVVHLTMSERGFVERYIRQTLVTFRENANEAARAVLSLPLVHDSMTLIMVDVMIQDIIRIPQPQENQSFYLKVLYAMYALEPKTAKAVEYSILAAMKYIQDFGQNLIKLEQFYGSWWSYLSMEAEDETEWVEVELDMDKIAKYVQARGNFINTKLWYDLCGGEIKSEEWRMSPEDKPDRKEIIGDGTEDKDKKKFILAEATISLKPELYHPLVPNFLRKTVEYFTLCVSPSTALTRLIGPLTHYIPPGDGRAFIEYNMIESGMESRIVNSSIDLKGETKEEPGAEPKCIILESSLIFDLVNALVLKDVDKTDDPKAVQQQIALMNLVGSLDSSLDPPEITVKEEATDTPAETNIEEMTNGTKVETVVGAGIEDSIYNEKKMESLVTSSQSDKMFSALFCAFLMRGLSTPAHFDKVVRLYRDLIAPFLRSGAADLAKNYRNSAIVEVCRFWQVNPVRLVRDIRTLIIHDLIDLEDVIELVCTALRRPDDNLHGLYRLADNMDGPYTALLPAFRLCPNGYLHSQLLEFLTTGIDTRLREDPSSILIPLTTLISSYIMRGSAKGVRFNEFGIDKDRDTMDIELDIHRSSLVALQLLERYNQLFITEDSFKLALVEALPKVCDSATNIFITHEELLQQCHNFIAELAR